MDSYGRMGLSAQRRLVDAHSFELRQQAAEARFARDGAVEEVVTRPVVGPSLSRRVVAFFERHLAHAPIVHRVGH